MKTSRSLIAILSVLVAGSATAAANDAPHDIVVTVPFEFSIGQTQMPRDTYRLTRASGHSDVYVLRSLRHGVFILGQRDRPDDRPETPAFVFHRYGDRYFLRAVQFLGTDGVTLPETRAERDVAELRAASQTPGSDVVVIEAIPR